MHGGPATPPLLERCAWGACLQLVNRLTTKYEGGLTLCLCLSLSLSLSPCLPLISPTSQPVCNIEEAVVQGNEDVLQTGAEQAGLSDQRLAGWLDACVCIESFSALAWGFG